jgi:hypothetical protein
VCDSQPGVISPAFSDRLGHAVYRLESRRDRTLKEVREQIRSTIERERIQSALARVRSPVSLELNEQYFGKLAGGSIHGLHFHATSMKPPSAGTAGGDHKH